MPGGRLTILSPVAPDRGAVQAGPFPLDRPLDGVSVGLRLDESWRSYFSVLDVWEPLLRADGASPRRVLCGDRTGPTAENTRTDLEEWSRLIDCGVVGLGN